MFSQFFGTFLLENGKLDEEQFDSCMEYIKANHVKLGLIAENEGLLTREQADELNRLQMHSDTRFGDLAIEKGYLTESDVDFLLSQQSKPYLIFVQALEEQDFMNADEIKEAFSEFQQAKGFSDEAFEALKNGDIESVLPTYIETDIPEYYELIALSLRNIVRFVSRYIRIEKASFVSSLSAKYIALQRTNGDYDGFLGFASDDDGILAIADGYAKEIFPDVDEDALDSVAEFTNCINGLHAAELSYKDVSIDMLPPELLFDATIEDEHTFCILPVYVENQKSNLIVMIDK